MPQHQGCRDGERDGARPDRILLAEANDIVRKALRRTLENFGYGVLEARSGGEAFDLCKWHEGPIDLLLSDISLPGVHGPELARLVTAARPLTRVIFLTGESDRTNSHAGLCPACWLLIRKPFRPRVLAHALREFLSRQPLQTCSADSLTKAGLVEPA